MRIVLAIVCALAGCIGSDSVKCGDVTCPAGTVCGAFEDKPICLTREQSSKCEAQPDGVRCIADDNDGICQQELCLPGCGDDRLDFGEECDDGNFTSHDGCSSSCLTEYAGWRQWQSPWKGRIGHVAGYHAASGKFVILGGYSPLGNFADQWTRDANGVWERSPSPLGPRRFAAMAYDSQRARLVLFGGESTGPLGDTWEYDGNTWTQKMLAPKPDPRSAAAMVFDPTRNKIVMYGGRIPSMYLAETWEYDGTWTQVTTATAPPARQWTSMAWDVARQRAVLFGGFTNGERFDTWEYANGVWTPINATTRPQARHGAAMAYSPSRGKVVLFGGALNLTLSASDTWEYDGTWTPLTPALSPEGRAFATLTFEASLQDLVLIEGADNAQAPLADIWRFNNLGQWLDVTPRFSPSARITPLVYDENRKELVLVNGCSEGAFSVGGTWTFGRDTDGEPNWKQANTSNLPVTFQRCYHALAYDSTHERTIMYGGDLRNTPVVGTRNDTWSWDGASWTELLANNTVGSPPDRSQAALVENPRDQTMVMFGGMLGAQATNETWELAGTTWTKRSTPTELAAQSGSSMAYDPIGERVVLFDENGKTWEYRDHTWTPVALDDSPGPRKHARVVWDPWRQRIMLFGGTGTEAGIDFQDLWELKATRWERVRLLGAQPTTRTQPAFAAYPELRSLVMFGGTTFDDTWFLSFVSDTPNENCSNGTDDDGDLQTDAADPDCTLYVFD